MRWLMRLLGRDATPPPAHIQAAIDTAAAADTAATDAKLAVRRYWRARAASDAASDVILDEYTRAERRAK